VNICRIL